MAITGLQSSVSNGGQSMLSKDIASASDRAQIIKQEIEKMKMRKVCCMLFVLSVFVS